MNTNTSTPVGSWKRRPNFMFDFSTIVVDDIPKTAEEHYRLMRDGPEVGVFIKGQVAAIKARFHFELDSEIGVTVDDMGTRGVRASITTESPVDQFILYNLCSKHGKDGIKRLIVDFFYAANVFIQRQCGEVRQYVTDAQVEQSLEGSMEMLDKLTRCLVVPFGVRFPQSNPVVPELDGIHGMTKVLERKLFVVSTRLVQRVNAINWSAAEMIVDGQGVWLATELKREMAKMDRNEVVEWVDEHGEVDSTTYSALEMVERVVSTANSVVSSLGDRLSVFQHGNGFAGFTFGAEVAADSVLLERPVPM